ncbi:hypothetical protein [Roseibium album]|uniref:Uncharacterized protein n=1 Tax=Roseibium album TaxID=311410 RepID=A0A0M6ZUK4_9HYPH|nr:hypothetical protein [Roseibium album]CTQ59462.1 hypothetical protein LA5094_02229 [Roseibium album]CTQ65133.1 hypothetical protein LA5096_00652 [Roseibium album]CTQ75025.1 hypothetical protein LA5095_03286 [Roseibium album]
MKRGFDDEDAMTEEELASIRQRCEKATSGTWISYIEGRDHSGGSNFIMTGNGNKRGVKGRKTSSTKTATTRVAVKAAETSVTDTSGG